MGVRLMDRYLVVRDQDGLVVNAVVWDGSSDYRVDGCSLIAVPNDPVGVWVGWTRIEGGWVPPVESEQT